MSVETTDRRLELIREQLATPLAEGEARIVETGAIPVVVRKRAQRYYIDDDGAAVRAARELGAPRDWLPVAERVADEHWLNVNRRGVVFVTAVEGRDIPSLVLRISDCAEHVQAALLDAAEPD